MTYYSPDVQKIASPDLLRDWQKKQMVEYSRGTGLDGRTKVMLMDCTSSPIRWTVSVMGHDGVLNRVMDTSDVEEAVAKYNLT